MTEAGVVLEWSTAAEENNSYFELRRSTDGGQTFRTFATVTGSGNTEQVSEYTHLDADYLPEIVNYYQLRQTDFDGGFEDSPVVSVGRQSELTTAVSIGDPFPNPTSSGELYLNVEAPTARTIDYQVLDYLGRTLLVDRVELAAGLQRLGFDVSQLAVGVYFARVLDAGVAAKTVRFTIR